MTARTVALLLLALAGRVEAATYYVAASGGSNANSCGAAQTVGTAKATVNAGITCATSAGDTVLVRTGNYNEGITSVTSGTSWSNKVRIAAYPNGCAVGVSCETVWLKPLDNAHGAGGAGRIVLLDGAYHYIEFDGINMDGTALTGAECLFWPSVNNGNDPHHIRLQNAEVIAGVLGSSAAVCAGGHMAIGATGANEFINLTIHGGGIAGLCGFACASYGIYLAGPNNLIESCNIYDTSGAGIQIYNSVGDSPDNNTIRYTRVHDISRTGDVNEVWGIIVVGSGNKIYDNLIYGISIMGGSAVNAGIALGFSGSGTFTGNKVWNNTLYDLANKGIYVGSEISGADIRNNIIRSTSSNNYTNAGASTSFQYNLCQSGCAGTGVLNTDPLFTSAGTGDFTLQAGSPAIDAGADLSAFFNTALNGGVSRPSGGGYDIGAYEYDSGGAIVASANCTRVGPSISITDSGGDVYALGTGTTPTIQILKNGVQVGVITGSELLYYSSIVYAHRNDGNWYHGAALTTSDGASDPSGTNCGAAAVLVRLNQRWWLK